MSKHTPGPWKVVPHYCQGQYLCVEIGDDGNYTSEAFLPADAHLIAAAPDLLEACKRASDRMKANPSHFDSYDTDLAEIETAIAKAEGK
jgi:hypothetical protein